MKKLLASALCAVMALSLSVAAFAAEPADISSNPTATNPTVTAPADITAPSGLSRAGYAFQVDGEDMGIRVNIAVPLRAVAEKLGFKVTWNGDGTIGLNNGVMNCTVTLGKDSYQVVTSVEGLDGMSAPFSLGMAPYTVGGTSYVPLGLFEALLGNQAGAVTMENGVLSLHTDPLNNNVQIPNPFVEYETLEQAAQAAGFGLTVPAAVNGSDSRVFQAIKGELLEVTYHKGEDETACIRKAPGSENISGDYTVYPQVNSVAVNGVKATMSGSDHNVSLATWTSNGYTYAVSVAGGISRSDMTALIAAIQ